MAKNRKRYLITGFSGFVGRYFFEYLNQIRERADLFGVDVSEPSFDLKNNCSVNTRFFKVDLLDRSKVKETILKSRPDFILHLASFSSVALSWRKPVLSFNNNTNLFLNLIEAVRETGIRCRVLSVGSSEEYGIVRKRDLPISESIQLNPISPYAVARVSQELLSKIYVDGYGLDIIMTRSFNHIGPRQNDAFAVSSFAKQMVKIKKVKAARGVLRTGDLRIVRDFLDVRDVVKAYHMLLHKGKSGEIYNVCSGKGMALKELVDYMADYLMIKIEPRVDRLLIRPNDNPILIGSNKKIKDELGWRPEIALEKSIADICDYWAKRRGAE